MFYLSKHLIKYSTFKDSNCCGPYGCQHNDHPGV